jgi:hypothetical protein
MDSSKKLQIILSHFINGQWEHEDGIVIQTLDNPGWMIRVSLFGTFLQGYNFTAIEEEFSEKNWYVCRVKSGYFEGFGGVDNLENVVGIFYDWFDKALSTRVQTSV